MHGQSTMYAYPPWARSVLALLVCVRFAGVWLVTLLVLLATDPPVTPPALFLLFGLFIVLPFGLEGALRAWFRGVCEFGDELWRLRGRRRRIEVPTSSRPCLVPWVLPLPRPGVSVRLRSGRVLPERLEGLAADLVERWICSGVTGTQRASFAFLRARTRLPARRLLHDLFKYAGFALPPALIAWNLHQHIAYGGAWGEFYLRGARAFLLTAVQYYAITVTYLLLYGGLLRSGAEVAAWVVTLRAPHRAKRWRLLAERFCQLGYYVGFPLFFALRLLG